MLLNNTRNLVTIIIHVFIWDLKTPKYETKV